MRRRSCLLFWCFLCVWVFFFLLSDNWAAMAAAFPPNGRGQINLPVLMSANGTGTILSAPGPQGGGRSMPRMLTLQLLEFQVKIIQRNSLFKNILLREVPYKFTFILWNIFSATETPKMMKSVGTCFFFYLFRKISLMLNISSRAAARRSELFRRWPEVQKNLPQKEQNETPLSDLP